MSFWKPLRRIASCLFQLVEAPWFIHSLAQGPFPPCSRELCSIFSSPLSLNPAFFSTVPPLSCNGSPDFMQNITMKQRQGISGEHGVFFIIIIKDRSCANSLSSWVLGSLRAQGLSSLVGQGNWRVSHYFRTNSLQELQGCNSARRGCQGGRNFPPPFQVLLAGL